MFVRSSLKLALALILAVAAGCTAPAPTPALALSPSDLSIPIGVKAVFIANFSLNAAASDAGGALAWTSSDPTIASVDANGVATGLKAGMVTIAASAGAVSATATLEITSAALVAIKLTPDTAKVPIGVTQPFMATGSFTDGSMHDVTSMVSWTSSDVTVATVGADGIAAGKSEGTVMISASAPGYAATDGGAQSGGVGDGGTPSVAITGTAKLTVGGAVLQTIDVMPAMVSIPAGMSQPFTAQGTFTDGTMMDVTSSVTWSTSDAKIATVSNDPGKKGLAAALAAGASDVIATQGTVTGKQTLTVTSAVLASIAITPANPSLAAGTTKQLTATATFSDNTTMDVTQTAAWSTGDQTIATVGNVMGTFGLLTGIKGGGTMISAALMNITGTTQAVVTPALLTSISLTPVNPQVPVGTMLQLKATGTFSDNTTQDLTGSAAWSSSDGSTVTVDNAMQKGLVGGVKMGASIITATQSGVMGTTVVAVTSATLMAITVAPTTPAVAKGTTQQFSATGLYSDKSTQDLSSSVTWTSSDMTIATISNAQGQKGLATAIAAGAAQITASAMGTSGSTTLTVTSATLLSIAVTPPNDTIAKGTTDQLTATGTYSDTSTQNLTSAVTWSTSDGTVATISNANGTQGLATGVAHGKVMLTATLGNVSGSTSLTVSTATLASIAITPANPSLAKGSILQLQATGVYSDNTTQNLTSTVTWSTSDAKIASVSNANGTQGQATGIAQGQVTVAAAVGNIAGTVGLTVSSATLSSITVSPSSPTVAKGTTIQLQATGVYSDNSTQNLTSTVAWSSSDVKIATVSSANGSQGLASGVSQGQITITAALGNIAGTTSLTVSSATLTSISVSPANATIANGTTLQLQATGVYSDNSTQNLTSTVSWSTGDPKVATISNANGSQGLATGVGQGQTAITAALGMVSGSTTLNVSAATLSSISINPANPTIAKGTAVQFVATGLYSDNSTQNISSTVTWAVADPKVATISNANGTEGKASGVSQGMTTVTATLGNVVGSTGLTVTSATLSSITVTPTDPSIAKGTTIQFTATGTYSDNSTQNVTSAATWASSSSAASVSNANGSQGLATGASAGTATISAAIGNVSGATILTVTSATLQSITVTPVAPTIAKGTSLQFTATGSYSDNSTQNLTTSVTWVANDPKIASISNAQNSQGLASGAGQGTTAISATDGMVTGSTTITVTAATLQTISVTPINPSVAKGSTVQFSATGLYSDNSTQDVTQSATWASSNQTVATVSNGGLASALKPGSTVISATIGNVAGTSVLGVSPATLTSIAIAPANATIAKGTNVQLTATGTYSDNSTQDLTSSVTWSSMNASVATVSNANGSQGLATGVGQGGTVITATLNGVSGTTNLTVSAATLTAITITPSNPTIAKGTLLQFTATGSFSDNSSQNLTDQVTWASANGNVASISNAMGSQGIAKGLMAGMTVITATLNGVKGLSTLTVTNATLLSITITPPRPTLHRGQSVQLKATGSFSDGSTQDVTAQATWSTNNMVVATVSNAPGSKGLTTGLSVGMALISATLNGVTGSTMIQVL